MRFETKTVAVAQNGTVSSTFTVEAWSIFYGILMPEMDNGVVGMEFSIDSGDNFFPVIDPADGEDAVLATSGSNPGWVDISDWIRFLPGNVHYLVRFTCASQTTAAVVLTIIMRG